jgi:hypothetical protein
MCSNAASFNTLLYEPAMYMLADRDPGIEVRSCSTNITVFTVCLIHGDACTKAQFWDS